MSTLLVATAGGHLAELYELVPRMNVDPVDVTWVTFDTPQSRSLLQGCDTLFIPHVGSRDYIGTAGSFRHANRILRSNRWDRVVTTGAAIAAAFMPLARARGIDVHYIESAARTAGPSATGRMARLVPGVNTYSQYSDWADSKWRFEGNVFDAFRPTPRHEPPPIRRILVTVGTMPYSFHRLIARLDGVLADDLEITWQIGASQHSPRRGNVYRLLPAAELEQLSRESDIVIAHAGVGSAMMALACGRTPILVPRVRRHGEHVDDHQRAIARDLNERGLAIACDASEIDEHHLVSAANTAIRRATHSPPFSLA